MKKIRRFAALVAGLVVAAMAITSCNDDSYVRELTPQEKQTAFYTVRGTHMGIMVYLQNLGNYQTKQDTVNVSWTIDTDSTMIIHDFPTAPFAEFVSDNELKQALLEQPTQDVKCKISFYSASPIWFYIGPDAPTYTLTYGGATHKVQLAFYINTNSLAYYDVVSRNMQMQLLGGGIYEDDVYKSNYLTTTNIPIFFEKK